MPAMMACRMEPMPLTMAVRQAPMVRSMDWNWWAVVNVSGLQTGVVSGLGGRTTEGRECVGGERGWRHVRGDKSVCCVR